MSHNFVDLIIFRLNLFFLHFSFRLRCRRAKGRMKNFYHSTIQTEEELLNCFFWLFMRKITKITSEQNRNRQKASLNPLKRASFEAIPRKNQFIYNPLCVHSVCLRCWFLHDVNYGKEFQKQSCNRNCCVCVCVFIWTALFSMAFTTPAETQTTLSIVIFAVQAGTKNRANCKTERERETYIKKIKSIRKTLFD